MKYCEYCMDKNCEDGDGFDNTARKELISIKIGKSFYMGYYITDRKLSRFDYLIEDDFMQGTDNEVEGKPIKFCPMCGRDLRKPIRRKDVGLPEEV